MSSQLESLLTPSQRADATAWDAKAAAALVADAKRVARKLPFDELVEHLEKARNLAAGLYGMLECADELHERIDADLEFARRECWPVDERDLADAKHDANEEFYMEQARGF